MKPLLAHIYEPHRVTFPCFVQPKLNGIRALYQNGSFQSRDQLPFPTGLLQHLVDPLRQVFDERIILDGELYVHGWPLQRINAAVTPVRLQPTKDTLEVEYHVFDVVDFIKPFNERMYWLDSILPPNGYIVGIKQVLSIGLTCANNQQQADVNYALFVEQGYEGMMYRLGDCPYTMPKQKYDITVSHLSGRAFRQGNRTEFLSDKNNRCWHLLKRKDWQDDEFKCVNVIEGEGKYKNMLGAVECVTSSYHGHGGQPPTFNVGSGFTDAEREKYWDHPELVIGKLVKVKYLVLSTDGIPLNPTLLAIL